MSNYNEQIEAKLCSYIDDDLTPEQRAEIEQYLAHNPQHRQLVDELRQTRSVLQGLRHEPAPPEIVEAVQGQIERSLLLNEDDGRSVILRIGRWPQFAAAAAMLLLATGLAFIVVKMLPQMHPVEVATPLRPADTTPPGDRELRSPVPALPERSTDVYAKGGLPSSPKGGNYVNQKDLEFARRLFQNDSNTVLAQVEQSVSRPNRNNGMVVVILNTSVPDEVNNATKGLLRDNNIKWQEQAEPMPNPLTFAQTQEAFGSRMNTANVNSKIGAEAPGAAGPTTHPAIAQDPNPHGWDRTAEQQPRQDPRIAMKDDAGSKRGDGDTQGNLSPKPAPAMPGDNAQPQQNQAQARTNAAAQQALKNNSYQNMIVARDLSPSQAAELTQNLRRQRAVKTEVFLKNESLAEVDPQQTVADKLKQQQAKEATNDRWFALGPATEDQKLRERQERDKELPPGGGAGGSAPAAKPSEEAKKTADGQALRRGDTVDLKLAQEDRKLTVKDNGSVDLPDGGELPVAGLTLDEARRALQEAMKFEAADQPEGGRGAVATTRPAAATPAPPAPTATPTTLPATRAAGEVAGQAAAAESNLDVVIVVQGELMEATVAPSVPATQPATVPAAPVIAPPAAPPTAKQADPDPADFKPAD